jgi:hypothetical protein
MPVTFTLDMLLGAGVPTVGAEDDLGTREHPARPTRSTRLETPTSALFF